VSQAIAVDWSGRAKGAAEAIWLARVARGDPRTIVGFDFAFSIPRWYCEANGWATESRSGAP
jgi:hypothetical protein